jgi:hypothetical protein
MGRIVWSKIGLDEHHSKRDQHRTPTGQPPQVFSHRHGPRIQVARRFHCEKVGSV